MEPRVSTALKTDQTIEITTMGKKSGRPHRIETWFHVVEGKIYLTGNPGKRDWYANLLANPEFIFHLKESTQADLPATARAITDPVERREILAKITKSRGEERQLDSWVAGSPLVEVSFTEEH